MSRLANALEGNEGKDGWGGVPYVRIDGQTDSRDRRTACLQFKEDPAIRVALLSITAAGMSEIMAGYLSVTDIVSLAVLLQCWCHLSTCHWHYLPLSTMQHYPSVPSTTCHGLCHCLLLVLMDHHCSSCVVMSVQSWDQVYRMCQLSEPVLQERGWTSAQPVQWCLWSCPKKWP